MVKHLYKDFLTDEKQYAASEEFWKVLTDQVSNSIDTKSDWWPWLNRVSNDGNPIWDARSRKLDRAFRILQYAPEENKVKIGAYMQVEKEDPEGFPRAEMVIRICLSEESAELAKDLLSKWMEPATTLEEMQKYIDEELPKEIDRLSK